MSIDLHTLTGAYALNAVSPEEAAEFEEHLEDCEACAQEVRELRDAAARVGVSEAMQPPPRLKALILAAADTQSQLPPRVEQPTAAQVDRFTERRQAPKRLPRLLAAAAAAVLIGGGAVGISQLNQEPDHNLAVGVTRVFKAEDANTKTMTTTNGGKVSVATSPSREEMAVDTDELPELSGNQVYQLWSVSNERYESAAVLTDPKVGASMAMPSPGIKVAITIEPDGGSEQPTTEPIMSVVPSEV